MCNSVRSKMGFSTLALCFLGATLCLAENALMGSWKLNEVKSELGSGLPKHSIVVYMAAGDDIKVTIDGTDKNGNSTHSEWTGKFDGKDYPVTGDPNSDTRSYTKIDDRTFGFNFKKAGKRIACGRIAVSDDGKIRTVTTRGIDSEGKKIMGTAVYDKE